MGVIVQLIRDLNDASNMTSIIVSHDVKETAEISDLVYVISDGRVMERGSPAQLEKSGSAWVRQFLQGLPDGPVHFHYPAEPLERDLLGG